MSQFNIGDRVRWASQAGGHVREKTGVIVKSVPPFVQMRSRLSSFAGVFLDTHRFQFDGFQRNHVCYFVEVQSKSGRGKPRLYCPSVSNLVKVND